MPKYLVGMNYTETKSTSFIIQAENENDIHDGLAELDFTFFEKNCQWTTTGYEPPTVQSVEETKKWLAFCDSSKNKKIQNRFNKIIKKLT